MTKCGRQQEFWLCFEARTAPSASERSLAAATRASTSPTFCDGPKLQSTLAITRSGPTTGPARQTEKVPGPFPRIEPHDSGLLDVGDGQQIYWEVDGNPDGRPAVVLNGGPGSGCTTGSRRLLDPAAYRIVLFDQRGSGRSRPRDGAASTPRRGTGSVRASRRRSGTTWSAPTTGCFTFALSWRFACEPPGTGAPGRTPPRLCRMASPIPATTTRPSR